MRMMKYTYSIFHVPGKNLVIADALSRAPSQQQTVEDMELNRKVDIPYSLKFSRTKIFVDFVVLKHPRKFYPRNFQPILRVKRATLYVC